MPTKRLIISLCFLALSTTLSAQKTQDQPHTTSTDSTLYTVVDEIPSFPGGVSALYKFLGNNIKYPDKAIEMNIFGTVACSFIIENNGSISHVECVLKVHPLLDGEAIRVIKKLPRWIPGKVKGEVVRCRYTIPITFSIPKEQDQ